MALAALGAAQAVRQIPQTAGLPPVSEEAAYWWSRALGTAARSPAKALLVSRFRFQRLRPFRSWQDLSALRDYVEWSDRAEAAGFENNVVAADVSANDLILLRIPASSVKASVPVHRDPVGYAVLDPGRAGKVRIPVTLLPVKSPLPALPPGLPVAPVPFIQAAVRSGPSLVVLYGAALAGRQVTIFSRRGPGKILYAGANQINATVPSLDQVSVEVDGLRSDWVQVQP